PGAPANARLGGFHVGKALRENARREVIQNSRDFPQGQASRAPPLGHEEGDERFTMRFDILERLLEDRSSRLPGQFAPRRKGSAGGRERCIHSVALNVGHFGEQLAGGGIKNIPGGARTGTFFVDQGCENAADAGGGKSTLAKR